VIKRPLVWMLGAYLLGLVFAGQSVHIGMLIILLLCFYILLYCFMSRNNRQRNGRDRFLWLLPLFILLGYMVTKESLRLPELSKTFEQQTACELNGRIRRISTKQKGRALYVENNRISLPEGGTYYCENIIVYVSDEQNYRVGNGITAQGILKKFSVATNPGQFNEQQYYLIENIDFKLMAERVRISDPGYSRYHAFLAEIKNSLIDSYCRLLGEREAGTLIAMLLGEKYLLEEEIKQLYQENGISHILAISGLHISLIGMGAFWLLRKCRLPQPVSVFLTLVLIYSYGELTNFSVSTGRAVVMTAVGLMALILGRTYDILSAAAFSAMVILLLNPLQIRSAGFLLSYSAVLGIAVILPGLRLLFPGKNPVTAGFFISLSAMLATAPPLLWFFGQFPVYSILTNLFILPFVTVLTLTSFLAGILGIVSPGLGVFAVGGAYYILKLYELICKGVTLLPGHLLTVGRPKAISVLLSLLFMLLFAWASGKYRKKYTVLLLAISLLPLFLREHPKGLEINLLDVGQGDGIFMESREGTTYLIDGGSSDTDQLGTYRIIPFLTARGTGRLDYVIVTHADWDHISGLSEIIGQELIPVGCLILPLIDKKEEAYLRLESLAMEKKIPVRYMRAGDFIRDGKMNIDCLHPAPGFTVTSANSYSVVLSVTYGDFDILLTGDLEGIGEELLIQRLQEEYAPKERGIAPAKSYEVLKVAHHGSRNSTPEELLQVITPDYALISCGRNNWYGHPHPELLARLKKAGSRIIATYEKGAISIRTDGTKLEIESFLDE
jgi:competence protein ComEC